MYILSTPINVLNAEHVQTLAPAEQSRKDNPKKENNFYLKKMQEKFFKIFSCIFSFYNFGPFKIPCSLLAMKFKISSFSLQSGISALIFSIAFERFNSDW